MSHHVSKLTRTELRIMLNADRGKVDLALRSLTIEELWQLILEMETRIATKLEDEKINAATPLP